MATNRSNPAKHNRYTKNFSPGKFHPSGQTGSPTHYGPEGLRRVEVGRKSQTYVIAKDSQRGTISVRPTEAEIIHRPSVISPDKISDTEAVGIHFSEDSYNKVWREIVSNRKK